MNEEFRKIFKNPDMFHRSIPFWAWNAKLEKDEIIRQIHEMKDAGMGGFFMHSRDGLETEYMGAEWKNCIRAAVGEARRLGMYAWLYDEDRWPSGTAGGMVPEKGDAYRCKGLTVEVCDADKLPCLVKEKRSGESAEKPDSCIGLTALYAAVICEMDLKSWRRLDTEAAPMVFTGEKVLAVRLEVSEGSEWFNGEAPPDNLNPACVDAFIEETHEKYRELVKDSFGKTIPGIFTDEPSLHDRHAFFGERKGWIPWTFGLSSWFKNLAGYDFFDYLPYIYFNGSYSRKIRHDYWYAVTLRFGEMYFKRIGSWCEKNQLLFTGHFLQEDKMGLSTRVNGAVMPNYRYQHVPGIDMLCERITEFLTIKQCTSIASQMGSPFVLSEMYGCTGWDFTFEGQKWIGDWQYVLGITRRCQHLALYSLRGCRKRDYPPSFNYQTPWWKENKKVEDYFARLGTALEEGSPVRKVLLLHPVSTVWSLLGVNPYGNPVRRKERDVPALDQYGEEFHDLLKYLLKEHFDSDLGDEIMIKEKGRIEEGLFCIGNAGYEAVVIPQVDTLMESTYKILVEYMDTGKNVILIGRAPFMTNGSEKKEDFRERFLCHSGLLHISQKKELPGLLEACRTVCLKRQDGKEDEAFLYQLRKVSWGYLLFVVNTDRKKSHLIQLQTAFCGVWKEMELLSGKIKEMHGVRNEERGSLLEEKFAPCQSRLYAIDLEERGRDGEETGEENLWALAKTDYLPEICPVKLSDPNVLTLDMCRFRMEDGLASEVMEVWQAQEIIREELGMRSIRRNGIEQRYRWIHKGHSSDGKKVELAFELFSDCRVCGCRLAVECLEDFQIYFNGKLVPKEAASWYLDRSFQTIPLPEIGSGANEIILRCRYRNDMELENIYVIGAFSVSDKRIIEKPVTFMKTGDWCRQGLFHYCGSVNYQYKYWWDGEGDKVLLSFEAEAVCINVEINGNSIFIPWIFKTPVDIREYLRPGENKLNIELVGSPRNMLGPFHSKEAHPLTTDDACFSPNEGEYEKNYQCTPYGLMKRPLIQIIKREGKRKNVGKTVCGA